MDLRRCIHIVLAFLCALTASGEDTMTGIFDACIKSLQVRLCGNDFAEPIAVIGSSDRICVDFDMLSEEREYLRYSLVHCNARWQPSGLADSEFVDGFNEGTIEDYRYSRATAVHYVHYSLTIPDGSVKPLISGNYLLRIYREDNPDDVLLQCRFMLCEMTAPVMAGVSTRTDIDYNASSQQVDFEVDVERAMVEDPFNDLLAVVSQNGRLDNEVAVGHPLRLQGTKAVFEHLPVLIFEAGNEYRRFETVSEQYPGMGVDYIDYFAPYRHYMLNVDTPRAGEPYSYDSTQHGRYFIRTSASADSDVDADYGVVHFALDLPEQAGSMIFLDGDFVQRRFGPESRMQYNAATGRYELAMLLKQGAYNYRYLIVPPGARRGYTGPIEGDNYQTVNEYSVKIYHRRRGERYDRLIGVTAVRSDM